LAWAACALLAAGTIFSDPQAAAQQPAKQTGQRPDDPYRIRRDVNLVVLHATVLDQQGRFVPDLKQENFRVFEDRVEQKLAIFRREDIPVTLGLVVDNSASMRPHRPSVNAAALSFVETSNREDEVFVVNFNYDYFLDLDKDFTNDIQELKEALERIDSRGSTALYDALIGSLDHAKKGSRDKKVLLVVTDGDDNASRKTLEQTIQEAQQSDTLIYTIGLMSEDTKGRSRRRFQNALRQLAEATGGMSFFPQGVEEVEAICTRIAHDIRNQYTLAYYPSNTLRDGTFRKIDVDVVPPRGRGKLSVRTRTGYYAQPSATGN
jgi:VWFA-related protein